VKEMPLQELIYKVDLLLAIPHMHPFLENLKIEAELYKNFTNEQNLDAEVWGSPDDVWNFWVERYHKSIFFVNFNKTHKQYYFYIPKTFIEE
jgi:hypothetical protein